MEEIQGQETPAEAPAEALAALNTADAIEQAQIDSWMQDNIPQQENPGEIPEINEEVPMETEAPEESTSKRFNRFAKKEREIQKERQNLKQMREELKPYMEAQEAAKSGDMLGAMGKVGWDYDKATSQVLNQGVPPQAKNNSGVSPEINERLAKFEKYEKEQQIGNYLSNLNKIVETDERYELIKENWKETVPMILQLQQISASENNKLRDHHNLLDDIEKYYEDIVVRLAGSKKIKSRLGLKDAAPHQDTPSDSPRTRPRTLRNSVSRPSPQTKREPSTRRERLEEALAVFETASRGGAS